MFLKNNKNDITASVILNNTVYFQNLVLLFVYQHNARVIMILKDLCCMKIGKFKYQINRCFNKSITFLPIVYGREKILITYVV